MNPDPAWHRSVPSGDRESRILAALAYFLVALSGLFLFVWRHDDRFVRFHALQAIVATVVFFGFGFVLWTLGSFPIFGFLYAYLLRLYLFVVFVYWLFLMVQAWRGERHHIPWIGRFIERSFE